jgi:hypothetical protein
MNPLIEEVLAKNSADIEAIVAKIGIGTLISLAPHFMAILKTVQETPPKVA